MNKRDLIERLAIAVVAAIFTDYCLLTNFDHIIILSNSFPGICAWTIRHVWQFEIDERLFEYNEDIKQLVDASGVECTLTQFQI